MGVAVQSRVHSPRPWALEALVSFSFLFVSLLQTPVVSASSYTPIIASQRLPCLAFQPLLERSRKRDGWSLERRVQEQPQSSVLSVGMHDDDQLFFLPKFEHKIESVGAALAAFFAAVSLFSVPPAAAVSGGGLDFAGSDISGQDFSHGNYKGKDFTQGKATDSTVFLVGHASIHLNERVFRRSGGMRL
jgi:hypothetical protein